LRKNALETTGTLKRVARILFLIISWSIIYLLMRKVLYGVDALGNPVTFYEGIRCILLCEAQTNLWFLYVLCAIYLVAPILHSFVHHADKRIFRYFVLLSFFAITVYRWACNGLCFLFNIESVHFEFVLVNSDPMTYFVAGYYFGYKERFRPLLKRYLGIRHDLSLCIAGLIGLVVLAAVLPGLVLWGQIETVTLNGNINFISTISLFLLLKCIGSSQWYAQSVLLVRGIKILAPLTLGVYVMHPFAQHLLASGWLGFSFSIDSFFPASSIPIGLVAIFFLTASAAYVMLKIPIVRYLVK
jgi:surface polysaccharide O-acyltransferase-like enzyme